MYLTLHISGREGWLYLAVIIDLFSRQVVGWSLNSRMSKDLIMNALRWQLGDVSHSGFDAAF